MDREIDKLLCILYYNIIVYRYISCIHTYTHMYHAYTERYISHITYIDIHHNYIGRCTSCIHWYIPCKNK